MLASEYCDWRAPCWRSRLGHNYCLQYNPRFMISPSAIFLMGPTAAGKTGLAVELARHFPCDIVSVDSALVYRGMDIGTAKPDKATLAVAPHRLIDVIDPAEAYSAARYCEDARREMAAISAAARIHPNDPQRIQRALEVYELTGRPLSAWVAATERTATPAAAVKLVVAPDDRNLLRQRISARFHKMLEQGLIAEIESLYRRGDLNQDLPSMRSVGYRQGWAYLEGRVTYSEMAEQAIMATGQLAKRQLTWLRREQGAQWFDGFDSSIFNKVMEYTKTAMKI